MTKQEHIEEMVSIMAASNNPFVDVPIEIMPKVAEALYNAGYQKIDEFAECRNCTAWSGTDCTRHPYTQGCLKDENNIKWQSEEDFSKAYDLGSKETAEKIFKMLISKLDSNQFLSGKRIIMEVDVENLAKRYGVEVED